MGALRFALTGALAAGLLAAPLLVTPAVAQEKMPNENWSFDRLFGTFDLAAAQRGFQVYSSVCSNCHSMQYLHYRDLSGIGLDADQIKAIAAGITVPSGWTIRATRRRVRRPQPASSNRRSPTRRPLVRPITAPCRLTCR